MNWIRSVIFGLFAGFAAPTPLSPEAHAGLLRHLMGVDTPGALLQLACHLAAFLVLLAAGELDLNRLRWAGALEKRQSRRRSAQADRNSLNTVKVLRISGLMTLLSTLLSPIIRLGELWMLAIPLALCGWFLYHPSTRPTGNMDGRHLRKRDGFLLGLAAMTSAIPGVSAVAMVCSAAALRGTSRAYGLRLAWLLMLVRLMGSMVLDVMALFQSGFGGLLSALFGGLSAALGAWLGVIWMRGLVRADGVHGFCYYNWGMALLCMVLYLFV